MSKFFINRPIVAMVIAIVTVIVGVVTIAGLPIAQFPNIAPPEVQILATYVGADALTLEQSVATPIEQQMSGVDNMNYMYSLNATGNSQTLLVVNFDVKTDPNNDLILAQSRETQAASQLRREVPCQLRVYQPGRFHHPLSRYWSGPGIRSRPVRHAALGQARSARQTGNHRPGDRQRSPNAEYSEPSRKSGRRTDPLRTTVRLCSSRAGTISLARRIRRDCGPRVAGWRSGARERRRPYRARSAGLFDSGALERTAERYSRRLSAAWIQCRGCRSGREETDGGTEDSLSWRYGLCDGARHDPFRRPRNKGNHPYPGDCHRVGDSRRLSLPSRMASYLDPALGGTCLPDRRVYLLPAVWFFD